ncbi:hypothetical protein AC579_10553 [Pseudocercospora musae]|uniref:Uncharacterized protein n=1 Tax=Pseudocercospora musae TaxID=113226 RepID=A0A139I093_9PEZI|nr:hypothetical protein AC579_10553 [Pseudocercospora musae]
MRQVGWAAKPYSEGTLRIICYNGFRQSSKTTDLDGPDGLQRHDTWQKFVRDPRDVAEAVAHITSAMKCAPYQQRSVLVPHGEYGSELPHCLADMEFKLYPKEPLEDITLQEVVPVVDTGELEPLAGIITVNVSGRDIHFCVAEMLQNANEHTVAATRLFIDFLYDPIIIQLWWNLRKDMPILHNTFPHPQQDSPREPY